MNDPDPDGRGVSVQTLGGKAMQIGRITKTALLGGVASALIGGVAMAENTVKWGAARDIVSMDSYSYGDSYTINVLNHIYEGLVRYNKDLELEPALATSWEVTSPTTWRFKLREGVEFHNGNPFNADD